jgi:hypothetical protein
MITACTVASTAASVAGVSAMSADRLPALSSAVAPRTLIPRNEAG